MSEPYFVPSDKEDWIADAKGLSVIIAPGLQLEVVCRDGGVVVAKCRGKLLVAVYLPASRTRKIHGME